MRLIGTNILVLVEPREPNWPDGTKVLVRKALILELAPAVLHTTDGVLDAGKTILVSNSDLFDSMGTLDQYIIRQDAVLAVV